MTKKPEWFYDVKARLSIRLAFEARDDHEGSHYEFWPKFEQYMQTKLFKVGGVVMVQDDDLYSQFVVEFDPNTSPTRVVEIIDHITFLAERHNVSRVEPTGV